MKLFFDTEITGLVRFDLDEDSPQQPRLVQLAFALTTDEGKIVEAHSLIVNPCGTFSIPSVVTNIHGIDDKLASDVGHNISHVFNEFARLYEHANELIAHNMKFDVAIIRSEMARLGSKCKLDIPRYCTMLASTSICGLKQKSGSPKWPKLSEAYEYFFKIPMVDNHDGLPDVLACKRIYFEGLLQHKFNAIHKAVEKRDMTFFGLDKKATTFIGLDLAKGDSVSVTPNK